MIRFEYKKSGVSPEIMSEKRQSSEGWYRWQGDRTISCSPPTSPTPSSVSDEICKQVKEDTGFSPSQKKCLKCQTYWTPGCNICAVNWNVGSEDLDTGKSLLDLRQKLDFEESQVSLDPIMPNVLDQPPRMRTSGRTTPEFPEPSLNWVSELSNETPPQIGITYENALNLERSTKFPVMYTFAIMGISEKSIRIMRNRCLVFGLAECLWVQLEQARVVALGQKQALALTLKVQPQNGGMAIKVMCITTR